MNSRVRNLVALDRLSTPARFPAGSIDERTQNWLVGLPSHYQGAETRHTELVCLQNERDPELLAASLLNFAGRQAQEQPNFSLEIYEGIANAPQVFGPSAAHLAERRGRAMLGHGGFGARFEVFASRFVDQATDVANLASMAVAGGVFQGLRLASLSRLLASPSTNFLTRGIGARGLSSVLAFAAEAPAFSATVRGANTVLGRSQDWSRESLGHELASGYMMLGALRLSGVAGNAAFRRFGGTSAASMGLQNRLFQQGAMLTGILAAHWFEGQIGLRDKQSGAGLLADSLATLLHFNVAGRLLHGVTGSRWNQELQLRQARMGSLPPFVRTSSLGMEPAFATTQGGRETSRQGSGLVLMTSHVEGPSSKGSSPNLTESSVQESSSPAPVKINPELYLRYRRSVEETGHLIYMMISEMRTGSMLWSETAIHVTRFLQDNCIADLPRMPLEHQATQRHLIANLGEIRASLEIIRNSMVEAPFDDSAVNLVSLLYRIPNRMVNYLNSGRLEDLNGSLFNSSESLRWLHSTLLPPHIVNRDSGEPGSINQSHGRRIVQASRNPWNDSHVPFYDFIDSESMQVDIPPETPRRILLLGNTPPERAALGKIHQVAYSESPRPIIVRLIGPAIMGGYESNIRSLSKTTQRDSFDYVEAYDALSGTELLTPDGHRWLQTRFFDSIRAGGIGLWMTRDTQSMELAVDLALRHEWADVILGSRGGESPLDLSSRSDFQSTNFVFFRKLPEK